MYAFPMGVGWTALVVDDAISLAAQLVRELEHAGARVLAASSVSEGIGHLIDGPIDVAIVKVELPGEGGLAVLRHLRSEGGQTPVLMLCLTDDSNARCLAFGQGCDDFLVKPVPASEIVARAQRRIEVHKALLAAKADA